MAEKIARFIEWGWLLVASVSFFEVIKGLLYGNDQLMLWALIATVALFMYFFRRNMRKKRSNQDNS